MQLLIRMRRHPHRCAVFAQPPVQTIPPPTVCASRVKFIDAKISDVYCSRAEQGRAEQGAEWRRTHLKNSKKNLKKKKKSQPRSLFFSCHPTLHIPSSCIRTVRTQFVYKLYMNTESDVDASVDERRETRDVCCCWQPDHPDSAVFLSSNLNHHHHHHHPRHTLQHCTKPKSDCLYTHGKKEDGRDTRAILLFPSSSSPRFASSRLAVLAVSCLVLCQKR